MSPFSELDGPTITDSSSKPADAEDSLCCDAGGPNAGGSSASESCAVGPAIAGRLSAARVLLLGKLASMPRREAMRIIRQHGGVVVAMQAVATEPATDEFDNTDREKASKQVSDRHLGQEMCEDETAVTMVVVGDDVSGWRLLLQQQYPAIAQGVDSGQIDLLQESEFWRCVGLVDPLDDVRRLYTPAMLAELLGVSVSAIRRWVRQGTLVACRQVRRLPYFDFTEVSVARHLADLHNAGCSLRVIDRKLRELAAMMPDSQRPLAEVGVVVEGSRLFIRRGDDLEEPSGQRQFDFDRLTDKGKAAEEWTESIPISLVESTASSPDESGSPVREAQLLVDSEFGIENNSLAVESSLTMFDRLLQEAVGYEDQGSLELAVETYRAILMAGGPSAEINFALADVLYRQGDYVGARERYYMAIEMDEEYVEARANLGCVLAEMDELEMAIAAFQGALTYHVDYADVHYHMAGALDRMQRHQEAQVHWRTFLALAPESAWAEVARMQLSDKQ